MKKCIGEILYTIGTLNDYPSVSIERKMIFLSENCSDIYHLLMLLNNDMY